MTKVLVTGATGFTGSHLTHALLEQGYRVRALVRGPTSKASHLAESGVEVVFGDLRNAEAVAEAVKGINQVYHIAAAFRIAGKPDHYYRDVNTGGTRNILSAARRFGVERVVHCSTVGVHGDVGEGSVDETAPYDPGDIYQQTKLEGELLAAQAFRRDLRGVIFRPSGIYGPGDTRFLKLFRSIQRRRFVMLGTGEVHYHLVHIQDLVKGILLCGSREEALGKVYILAGEGSISLNEFCRLVSEAMGVPQPKFRVPLGPVAAAAHVCEVVCKPLGISPPLYPRRTDFFCKHRSFIIDRAKQDLGYVPSVSLVEGLRQTAEWYVQQGLLRPVA